jgi:hypothetical protein
MMIAKNERYIYRGMDLIDFFNQISFLGRFFLPPFCILKIFLSSCQFPIF